MKFKTKNSEKCEQTFGNGGSKSSVGAIGKEKPDIKMVAVAKLQDTEDWYTVFQFRRHDGLTAYMAMPSGSASASKALAAALRNAGASGSNSYTFENVVAKLTSATAPSDGSIVIRGGWGDAGNCFALPDGMLVDKAAGKNGAGAKFICLDFNSKKRSQLVVKDGSPGGSQLDIGCRGTTKSWQKKVALPALSSSFMMSGICAGFAAPVLKLMGVAPFTVALTGDTTTGKTTVTAVSASVVGFGTPDQLPTWNMTPAGLEERAEIHFDTLLPIDDLNSAPEADKKKFQLVNAIAYRITGGSKKHTLSMAKSGITGRPPVKGAIRTIILTSAEDSMADIAAAAKMQLPGGFFSRLVEVPVPKAKDGGVYDLANFKGKLAKRVKAARKISKAIASACERNHGYVLRKYIKATIKDPERAKRIVGVARDEFMGFVGIDRTQAIHWRRAEIFAFLYGAGVYAITLELLPWTVPQLRDGILKCLAASWTTLPESSNLLEAGLRRLRSPMLRADRIIPAADVTDLRVVDGWWEIAGSNKTYFILGDRFRDLFASSVQQHRVERFLLKHAILIPDAQGKPTKQPVHPGTGKKAPRCYELRVPADGSHSVLFPGKKTKGAKPRVTGKWSAGKPAKLCKTKKFVPRTAPLAKASGKRQ